MQATRKELDSFTLGDSKVVRVEIQPPKASIIWSLQKFGKAFVTGEDNLKWLRDTFEKYLLVEAPIYNEWTLEKIWKVHASLTVIHEELRSEQCASPRYSIAMQIHMLPLE